MYHNHCSPCFPSPVFIAWIIDPEADEEKEEVKRTFYIYSERNWAKKAEATGELLVILLPFRTIIAFY